MSEYDFVIVGSGAGGGPLAANLALAGFKVLLLEAGEDLLAAGKTDDNYSIPAFHALASEDPASSWEFFVEHYADEDRRRSDWKRHAGTIAADAGPFEGPPSFEQPVERAQGVFYPRASALGGCTTHHALITVYPADEDWDGISALVQDPSWSAGAMRKYFDRIENARYRDASVLYSLPGLTDVASEFASLFEEGVDAVRAQIHDAIREPRKVRGDLGVVTANEFGKGAHGPRGAGWLTVTQADPKLLLNDENGAKKAVIAAFKTAFQRGVPPMPRLNPNEPSVATEKKEGVNVIPISVDNGRRTGARERVRAAQRLLQSAKEQGLPAGQLTLETNTFVTAVEFAPDDPTRAIGVRCAKGERLYGARHHRADPPTGREELVYFANKEVILCGGAFNTPQLLMLSGIGPKADLEALGISVRIDSPGVGKNLQDRYEVGVVGQAPRPLRTMEKARFESGHESEAPDPDPHKAEWKETGKGIYATNGAVVGIVMRSSQRTREQAPDLYVFGLPLNFQGYYVGYSRRALAQKDYFTWAVLKGHTRNASGEVTLRTADPFDTPNINFKYFDESKEDGGSGEDLQAVIDGVEFALEINRSLIDDGVLAAQVAPQLGEDLREYVKKNAWGHHASCTCRIGPDGDPMAVLDKEFQVRGARNLRVVDASVFPRIPGLFILASVYMISEKASETIIAKYR
ncbi:GMC family oxidoreductase [Methylocystis parvus]|uniref:Glucose-methanol-choline oxidoreductase N-terminal domain-containing protein n=1 Tax=Methylocystis parvus TaxID=134 RepID=A0A6B8MAA6_9HYPH|nr:GMC oxidoreductase [Methylocystis parvus]QGM98682.1 hypothetical protein F7D14_15140 [Methylocystis parvus]WBK00970.1 GMC oxidoreductase [Methylocystis parvus OBBP]